MAINFAHEYKLFRQEQEKLRKEYEALGMSEEQIQKMYEFDLHQFNRDLAYCRHTLPLTPETEMNPDDKNPLLLRFMEKLSITQQPDETEPLWWLNEIEDEVLYEKLLSLSGTNLQVIDLLAFQGFSQAEIADKLGISQSAVAQQIKTIRKRIKKSE